MRIIKLAIISFVFFFLLITGISLFFPAHIRISRAIDINANKDSVLGQINDVTKWKNWYPGADSLDFLYINGIIKGIKTDSLQGVMIQEVNDSAVLARHVGLNSGKSETGWNIFTTSIPNTVTVQWFMDFHLKWYPWEKFSSMLLENRYGPMLEQGLAKLKKVVEK